MTSQKLLIVGGSGQVGTALRTHTAASRFDVIAPTSAQLDLTEAQAVDNMLDQIRPDVVINAAAFTAVEKAEDESDRAYRVNGEAVGILGRACDRVGARLLHISTDYVFDGEQIRPYVESDRPNPINVYGASKLAGETALSEVPATILRIGWVYSATGSNFVKTMLNFGQQRDELRVVDDQFGTPCCAEGVADALYALADLGSPLGLVHYATEPVTNWHEFACEITATLPSPPRVTAIRTDEYPSKARRPGYAVLDDARLRDTIDVVRPNWHQELAGTLRRLGYA